VCGGFSRIVVAAPWGHAAFSCSRLWANIRNARSVQSGDRIAIWTACRKVFVFERRMPPEAGGRERHFGLLSQAIIWGRRRGSVAGDSISHRFVSGPRSFDRRKQGFRRIAVSSVFQSLGIRRITRSPFDHIRSRMEGPGDMNPQARLRSI